MIIRELRGRVPLGGAAELERHLSLTLRLLRDEDGFVEAFVGRQIDERVERFVMTTVWRDLDAIYRWIRCPDLLRAAPEVGGDPSLLVETEVQHWEMPSFAERPGDAASGRVASGDRDGDLDLDVCLDVAANAARGRGAAHVPPLAAAETEALLQAADAAARLTRRPAGPLTAYRLGLTLAALPAAQRLEALRRATEALAGARGDDPG